MSAKAIEAVFQLLNEGETAKRLRVSRACLRNWRVTGQGPPYIRLEKRLIRYNESVLREWIERQAGVER